MLTALGGIVRVRHGTIAGLRVAVMLNESGGPGRRSSPGSEVTTTTSSVKSGRLRRSGLGRTAQLDVHGWELRTTHGDVIVVGMESHRCRRAVTVVSS